MNITQSQAKDVLAKAIYDVRVTWPLMTLRELQEVLISCAGDLAAMEKDLMHGGSMHDPETCGTCTNDGEFD